MSEAISHRAGHLLGGRWLLEELLGFGSVGEVYSACETGTGRRVAIKLLRPRHVESKEVVERFMREARAANLVRHPHVVDLYAVDQDEMGTPFIVQELLVGSTLAKHLDDLGGRVPIQVVLDVMLAVIDAVGFAHKMGIVHRDIKPENIFLAKVKGLIVPKLLDFGISRIMEEPGERLTAGDTALGTPAYMSPEQSRGARNVDARTDVWALGVILYELIAGRLPYDVESVRDLAIKIATEDPIPIAVTAPSTPFAIQEVIMRCLSRNREGRYPDGAALARDLRDARDEDLGLSTTGVHLAKDVQFRRDPIGR